MTSKAKVLQYIGGYCNKTNAEIAQAVGKSIGTVVNCLSSLREEGILTMQVRRFKVNNYWKTYRSITNASFKPNQSEALSGQCVKSIENVCQDFERKLG